LQEKCLLLHPEKSQWDQRGNPISCLLLSTASKRLI
jgi:hypothetical protein